MTQKQDNIQSKVNNQSKGLMAHAQYIKDLSFENPNSPYSLMNSEQAAIDINIDIISNDVQLSEEKQIAKEIVLHISIKSHINSSILFIIELQYAGLFSFDQEAADGEIEMMSKVHCPHIIFPFARQIIAEISGNSGFHPLMLNLIDFNGLYLEQKKQNTQPQSD